MNTQTIEQLVFECGLSTPTVIVPAMVMLLLCAWLLFQERNHLGIAWVFVFWSLRAVALAVLVWMFLQPTRVTETKSTLPQSVAMVVDSSESMSVVDPAGQGQSIRWQLSGLSEDEADLRKAQTAVDSALIAIEVAQSTWLAAQETFQSSNDGDEAERALREVAFALKRAATQLSDNFRDHWTVASDQTRAEEFSLDLMELADFAAEINLGSSSKATGEQTQLLHQHRNELVDLNRLARAWGRTLEVTIADRLTDHGIERDRQTQVKQLVTDMQQQAPTISQTQLSIKRYTFDDQLTPVLSTNGWDTDNSGNLSSGISDDKAFDNDRPNEDVAAKTTNLTAAIEQIMQLANGQAIRKAVFLTDGAHNAIDTVSPVEIAGKWKDLAISFVPIGSLKQPRDLRLYHVEHPRSVIRGDKILIEALVSANGFEGESIDLELWADGKLFEKKTLPIEGDQVDLRHSFTVPTTVPGSIEFELKIAPLEDEISTANNRAIFLVGVVQDKIRVMLADRISRWEYRYLDQLLFRDKHLEHEMILFDPRLRATGKLEVNAAIPATVDQWSEYDVALIGDLTPDEFPESAQEAFVDFIKEKGGIAILMAGRRGMPHSFEDQPLFDVLPVERSQDGLDWDQYHVKVNRRAANVEALRLDDSQPTSERLWHQIFQAQPITWLSDYCSPRPAAQRLLDVIPVDDGGEGEALAPNKRPSWVCWQQVGAGRVVYLSAPDSYRLRYRRGDRLHHLFWSQLLRWVTSSAPGSNDGRVQLTTDKVKYQQHELTQVAATLFDEAGQPVSDAQLSAVFTAGRDEESVFTLTADETQPGGYIGNVEGLPTGAYRVVLRGDEVQDSSKGDDGVKTFVNITAQFNQESVNTTCNRPLMKQIAEVSGGQVIPPTALAEWLTLQTGIPETILQVERQPLWNRWSSLWIAFGCLATEWFVRRMRGLT